MITAQSIDQLLILGILAAAGSAGAMLRYFIDVTITGWQQRRHSGSSIKQFFPWGIFWANTIACFILALTLGYGARHDVGMALQSVFGLAGEASAPDRQITVGLIAISFGFCGSLSTMSTFILSVISLMRSGARLMALSYLTASFTAGLLAACLGLWLIAK